MSGTQNEYPYFLFLWQLSGIIKINEISNPLIMVASHLMCANHSLKIFLIKSAVVSSSAFYFNSQFIAEIMPYYTQKYFLHFV